MNKIYDEVIQANIALHTKMSDAYSGCEPHFRPENVEKVRQKIKFVADSTKAKNLLDLGCGTGFIINIAKSMVPNITGLDVTQAMLDKVDTSGDCDISLHNVDTGSFNGANGNFDMVTAYSFLHHLYDVCPTLETAYKALKQRGMFYADLDPNFYFWEGVNDLSRDGTYDPIIRREINAVTYKDEDIQETFGVKKEVFNKAEYGKNIAGGFKEEELVQNLKDVGFSKVDFFYNWYIGQGHLINNEEYSVDDRFLYAGIMDDVLQKTLPLSRNLFKYVGFIATK